MSHFNVKPRKSPFKCHDHELEGVQMTPLLPFPVLNIIFMFTQILWICAKFERSGAPCYTASSGIRNLPCIQSQLLSIRGS